MAGERRGKGRKESKRERFLEAATSMSEEIYNTGLVCRLCLSDCFKSVLYINMYVTTLLYYIWQQ